MDNPIRALIYSRIKALLAQSEGLDSVNHNLTKGELREQLLLDFFKDILPDRFTVCSGFVVDIHGNTSPQIDFIVAETTDIPRLILNQEVSLVPAESVRAVIEIKTKIESKHWKDQIPKLSQSVLEELHQSYLAPPRPDLAHWQVPIRVYVIGFDADEGPLKKNIKENFIEGCCVVGKYSYMKHYFLNPEREFVRLEDSPDEGKYEATATFLGCVFRDLMYRSAMHSPFFLFSDRLKNYDPEMAEYYRGKEWFWEAYVSDRFKDGAANHRPLGNEGE